MMGKRQILSLFVIAKYEKDGCPTREGKKRKKKRAMHDKLEVVKMIPSTKMKAPRNPKKKTYVVSIYSVCGFPRHREEAMVESVFSMWQTISPSSTTVSSLLIPFVHQFLHMFQTLICQNMHLPLTLQLFHFPLLKQLLFSASFLQPKRTFYSLSPQLEALEISLKFVMNDPHCKVVAKEEIILLF